MVLMMTWLEKPMLKYLIQRFKEPSSWAALGTLLLGEPSAVSGTEGSA